MSEPAVLPAISLPSSLKAARVSLSSPSPSQLPSNDSGSDGGTVANGSISQHSDGHAGPAAGSRASTGVNSGGGNNSGISSTPATLRTAGTVPGILPKSAFLTPRKPAGVAARQQRQRQQSPLRPGASLSLAASTNNNGGDGDGVALSQPSSASTSMRASTSVQSSHAAYPGEGSRETAGIAMFPIDETRPSASSSDYAARLQVGTLGRSGSSGGHTRAESRQETIRSKASREPLIENGLPRRSVSSAAQNRPENGKRKNSKTGSITSLLGFGKGSDGPTGPGADGRSSKEGSEKQRRKASRSVGSSGMSPLHEINVEQKSPARHWQPAMNGHQAPHDAEPPFWNSTDRVEQPHHQAIRIPVIDEKTQKPLRNYRLYRQQQQSSKPTTVRRSILDRVCSRRPPGHANGTQEPLAFGYGTNNLGGNNRFLLSGRLVTSGDSPYPFLGALAVALFMPGIFLAFEAEWLWHSNADAGGSGGIGTAAGKALVVLFAYTTLIMWSSMLRTSLRDPGIIPKGLDREPDFESFAVPVGGEDDLTGTGMGQRPRFRQVRVRESLVASKWCETCQTYRPPRTSHCRLCDVCTEQTDHHCSFLNNCIGRRNYPSFAAFLLSACTAAAFVIGISIAHLVLRGTQIGGTEFWTSWRTIGTLIVLIVTFAAALPLMALTGYHAYLIWHGRTTIETVSHVWVI